MPQRRARTSPVLRRSASWHTVCVAAALVLGCTHTRSRHLGSEFGGQGSQRACCGRSGAGQESHIRQHAAARHGSCGVGSALALLHKLTRTDGASIRQTILRHNLVQQISTSHNLTAARVSLRARRHLNPSASALVGETALITGERQTPRRPRGAGDALCVALLPTGPTHSVLGPLAALRVTTPARTAVQ